MRSPHCCPIFIFLIFFCCPLGALAGLATPPLHLFLPSFSLSLSLWAEAAPPAWNVKLTRGAAARRSETLRRQTRQHFERKQFHNFANCWLPCLLCCFQPNQKNMQMPFLCKVNIVSFYQSSIRLEVVGIISQLIFLRGSGFKQGLPRSTDKYFLFCRPNQTPHPSHQAERTI